jgi:prepilin-type N-terminal cleavage/methylation domain-containing protein
MIALKQKGFTLVEIAIVLVVIGLLLGGILKGQQLINSARVRNLADQSSGVQAAYYGFVDRFRNVPGDMDPVKACTAIGKDVDSGVSGFSGDCSTATIGGNGNGQIDTIAEAGAVWAQMSTAGFLNGTYTGNTPDATSYKTGVSNGAVPANAFQGPIMLAHMANYIQGNATSSIVRLAFSFGGLIPVPILRDLDQKVDDGVAGSGVLRSSNEVSSPPSAGSADFNTVSAWTTTGTATNDCIDSSATANWNVDSSDQTCNAIFLY